jgi:PhnB protein
MSFAPYLTFDGNCREAMTFYADIFGAANVQFMTWADAPEGSRPPGDGDKIMHSLFMLNGHPLMGADAPPGWFKPQTGVSVFHGTTTKAEAERVFARLSEGATVQMPMAATFWTDAFGMLTDRFGTSWMVTHATEVPA